MADFRTYMDAAKRAHAAGDAAAARRLVQLAQGAQGGPTGADAMRARGLASPDPSAANAAAEAAMTGGYRGTGGGRGTAVEAALIGARQGVTLGFGDEINAAVRAAGDVIGPDVVNQREAARQSLTSALPGLEGFGPAPQRSEPVGFGEAYDRRLAHERGLLAQTRQENPIASTVGEIAGAVALPGGAASSATTVGGAALRGAAASAPFGSAYGFGEAEGGAQERLAAAAEGAATGALFGAAANAAINVGTRSFRRLWNKASERPTLGTLRAAKDAAYRAVDDAGEVFQPAELRAMSAAARDAIESSGHYVPDVDRQTHAVLTILDRNSGRPQTIGQLDKLRQMAWKRYNAAPNETAILDVIESIDDLIASRESTSGLMAAARAAHGRFKRAELLESAFKRARDQTSSTGSGGNILNKYRQAVTSIVNNPKQAKWFTAEELATMQRLIDGTVGENVMRRIGKLSPSGNGLMLALNLLGGAQFGLGSLAVTGIAAGAKEIADRSGEAAAGRVLDAVSGAAPRAPVTVPQAVNALSGYAGSRY